MSGVLYRTSVGYCPSRAGVLFLTSWGAPSHGRDAGQVGAVDCEKDGARCQKEGATGYPTIMLYKAGGRGSVKFEGEPTAKALHDFVVEHLPAEVTNLRTPKHLADFKEGPCAKASSGCCAILLTDKYDTSPLYKTLSVTHSPTLAFGEARASNQKLGAELGVSTFPTLVVVCGKKVTPYDGEMKAAPLNDFLSKYSKKGKGKAH